MIVPGRYVLEREILAGLLSGAARFEELEGRPGFVASDYADPMLRAIFAVLRVFHDLGRPAPNDNEIIDALLVMRVGVRGVRDELEHLRREGASLLQRRTAEGA